MEELGVALGEAARLSRFYVTPAYPAGSGPDFVNAAALFRSDLAPDAILDALHAIEARAARTRPRRWGPRTLDLDLLAVGDRILPDRGTLAEWMELTAEDQVRRTPDRLILPHPRLQDRAFVLVPLAEVAPDWMHPVLGLSVAEMRDRLPAGEKAAIQAISP